MASGDVLIYDSADKTPPPAPGRHPHTPIGWADGARPAGSLRLPAQVWILITLGVLLPIGVGLFYLVRWLEREPELAALLGWAAFAAVLVLIAGGAYAVAAGAWSWAATKRRESMRAGVERTRFGVPVAVEAIYARDAGGALAWPALELERAHLAYESARAPYSVTPMLSTRSGGDTVVSTALDAPQLPAPAAAAQPPAETLDELERRGIVRASDYSLFIGYGEGREGDPVNWLWSRDGGAGEAVVAAVGGAPGSGKTTTASQIAALALRKGVDLFVFDPQRDSGETQTLTARLGAAARGLAGDVAADESELAQLVAHVESIGRRRERGEDSSRAPVLAVLDEFSGTLLTYPNAGTLIATICSSAAKYRKFGVRWLLVGPSWKSNLIGGELGTTLASLIRLKILHAMAPAESAFLTYGLSREQKQQIEQLAPGAAIVYGPSVYKSVLVPNLMPQLAIDVAQRLTPREAPRVRWGETPAASMALGAPGRPEVDDAIDVELSGRVELLRRRGLSRDRVAAALLLTRTPARVRGGWAYHVKRIARSLSMSDAEIAAIAARAGRAGSTAEG